METTAGGLHDRPAPSRTSEENQSDGHVHPPSSLHPARPVCVDIDDDDDDLDFVEIAPPPPTSLSTKMGGVAAQSLQTHTGGAGSSSAPPLFSSSSSSSASASSAVAGAPLSSSPSSSSSRQCLHCGARENLEFALANVGHFVCMSCYRERKDFYRQIAHSNAMREYGLSSAELEKGRNSGKLAVSFAPNPRGYKNQMKLYFVFQVSALGAEKFGSLEKLRSEMNRRRDAKVLGGEGGGTGGRARGETARSAAGSSSAFGASEFSVSLASLSGGVGEEEGSFGSGDGRGGGSREVKGTKKVVKEGGKGTGGKGKSKEETTGKKKKGKKAEEEKEKSQEDVQPLPPPPEPIVI
uniref:XPA C-terminal domain-containing protein n=1 Tax=Chromera velia CCMP2878 TaxID=1169474 RepID=A0A0G4HC29_9ALVE|eukprot:Cvel_6196.t1-p1 / transcript=Cvel_6196.t1 / gene=Cvel_6196 / organism=Chromera_velia_CCMP2878 / gene_product=hypothetical protein / transcript_product=hypothetical protein / location=Cvel_scaffold300:43933-46426(+) / protein_length=351 / sequence_SO=supercontig / SO=protein_coding / is_pseudo=false